MYEAHIFVSRFVGASRVCIFIEPCSNCSCSPGGRRLLLATTTIALLEVAEPGVLLVGVITGVAALDLFAIEVDAVGVLKTSLLELSQFKLMFSLSKVKI